MVDEKYFYGDSGQIGTSNYWKSHLFMKPSRSVINFKMWKVKHRFPVGYAI